ncbi:MAG: AAA family ATPase [Cyanobacteriota bacterium]|nr:AAA family ATPase [Cyanobacteriota bacterium]
MTNGTIILPGYKILEEIYNGSRTLVYRGRRERDDKAVAIKILKNEYPTFNELLQFRNQYTIALNLKLPGTIETLSLERYRNGYAAIMEDIGAISLAEYAAEKELSLKEVLLVGICIAETLEGLYQNRVVHKDIKPANILINPQTKEVKLIDFSISTLLPKENQEVQNPNVLEGTLAYMSPEQTGRMNRGIDYRTDFYSLGVSLYELLVGQLPFESADPIELVHSHIARKPKAPSLIKPEIPKIASNIILKLMAKTPEQRYQSARGILFDLVTCLQQWESNGRISHFLLGQRDRSDRFVIPEKLYGREREIQTLLGAFQRVSEGSIEMMLVAGFSGIGKTALVSEVHKPIVQKRGYFIKGKFDQFKRNIPFSALAQAFSGLMGQLLSESAEEVEGWKKKILEAVGEQGRVIIDVIPELEAVIGKQPPVSELDPGAAQNRFNLLFQKFIRVFPTAAHPLVIFLDDLQWADLASLKLMQLLMNDRETGYLLLIGAYRDNEVSPTHPLMLAVGEMEKGGAAIARITLEPLDRSSLNSLVADALCCGRQQAGPLTELIDGKTRGNPFFATQFLKSLQEDGLIEFDFRTGSWQCDLAKVQALSLTSDVVEFMAGQLQKLPGATGEVLKRAACIGNQFDLETLAIAMEKSVPETAGDLWKALQAGLIIPLGQIYKFYQQGEDPDLEASSSGSTPMKVGRPGADGRLPNYKFLHDRVQQAAYSLIPEEEKRATHLKIGQLLLNKTPEAKRQEKIFSLVDQLNYGVEFIARPEEREELARLNLAAGTKAKAATAYEAAGEYFAVGRELLAADSWESQYELTLALYESAASVAYLNGEFEEMEGLIEEVLREGRTLLEQVKVYEVRLQAYAARNQFVEAIETAFSVLKLLGVSFPEAPTDADIQQAFAETRACWSDREIEELNLLPAMSEPEKTSAMGILASITPAAYIALPQFLPLIVCEQVKLSIKYGNDSLSAYSYATYGTILCGVVGDIESGYQFGKLALNLLSKFNLKKITAKVIINTGGDIRHWKEPARETIKPLLSAYQTGLEAGDLELAAYCAFHGCCNSYFVGSQLIELQKEVATYSQAFLELKQERAFSWSEIHRQGILNLIEPAVNPGCLVGEAYNEEKSLPFQEQANDRLALHLIYGHKLILNYLFEEVEKAVENAAKAESYLDGVTAMLAIPAFYLYDSLARLRWLNNREPAEVQTQLEKVAANQKKMQKWATHAPMNHSQKFNLVEAERYRVLGEDIEAMKSYDRAIAGAKENGYIQEEALANELAAKFYLQWGNEKIAAVYIGDAYYAYARWGALAKVEDLEIRYRELLGPLIARQQANSVSDAIATSTLVGTIAGTTADTGTMLDIRAAIAAARAISGALELDKLLSSLMRVAIENAGAEVGYLIAPRGEELVIEASGAMEADGENQVPETFVVRSLRVRECEDIPQSIINYVYRTWKTVVIDDAAKDTAFAGDPYIIWQQPQSLLCAPIKNQGKLIGILYLENNLVTGAFTSDRLELLNLLCSQAGISLENARLYQNSQNYAQQLKSSLQELQQAQLQLVQSEKMSALGQLVAGVAHEINNPLGFIIGNIKCVSEYARDMVKHLQLYQQKYPQPGPEIEENAEEIDLDFLVEDFPEAIEVMTEATTRIQNLSSSLRTFSRSDAADRVPFDLHKGIDSTLLILKHRLKAKEKRKKIEVIKKYGQLPEINCHAGQLNQVFMNIIANAIDAFDDAKLKEESEGGKNLQYRIAISTEINRDAGTVCIKIKDNGPGIPPQVKSRIFNDLFTTKAVGKGTGLGLSISRQIVEEKHGGKLSVISTLGQGAEFIIEIPMD